MNRRRLRHVARDRSGVTAVEFALIAPVFLIGLLGVFDLGHNMYTAALLQGAIQKAARDSTIETAESAAPDIDARVSRIVRDIAPHATLTFSRKSYTNFSDVRRPEDFTDVDGDGVCDDGEPFEDANGNGAWDADRGKMGMGGARDAVLYEVAVTYPRAFPIARLTGQKNTMTIEAKTVLRNQPYALQGGRPPAGKCA
jgi:Flp pilus assembly pilin Flp